MKMKKLVVALSLAVTPAFAGQASPAAAESKPAPATASADSQMMKASDSAQGKEAGEEGGKGKGKGEKGGKGKGKGGEASAE
jgi:hypothetical protein